MSTAYLKTGTTETITLFATNGAALVTGVTWALKIVRQDTGQYWNGSGWQSGVATVSMTEVDSTNRPGEYRYQFTPPSYGYVCSILATTASSAVAQRFHTGTLHVGYGFARDAEIAKKYVRNKLILSAPTSGTYEVKDDDGSATFETGTFDETSRQPS